MKKKLFVIIPLAIFFAIGTMNAGTLSWEYNYSWNTCQGACNNVGKNRVLGWALSGDNMSVCQAYLSGYYQGYKPGGNWERPGKSNLCEVEYMGGLSTSTYWCLCH